MLSECIKKFRTLPWFADLLAPDVLRALCSLQPNYTPCHTVRRRYNRSTEISAFKPCIEKTNLKWNSQRYEACLCACVCVYFPLPIFPPYFSAFISSFPLSSSFVTRLEISEKLEIKVRMLGPTFLLHTAFSVELVSILWLRADGILNCFLLA